MTKFTRRQVLENSILATAAAVAAATPRSMAADTPTNRSPNETIRLAVLGCRVRGGQHVASFTRLPNCEIAYVCDPDIQLAEKLADKAQALQKHRPKVVRDMRKVFDDADVDAVSIATPNHWHALASIWAMLAGKDVYVEKPVSHNVWEGRRIVEVADATGRICQAGTQRRSDSSLAAAAQYIHQGKLGDVNLARSIVYRKRTPIGKPGKYPIPKQVDYNLFTGPATMAPLARPQLHYDWHWFWETGNGELGNNNIHIVDVCRWGLGVTGLGDTVTSYGGRFTFDDAGQTPNTQVVIHDFGDKRIIQETRNLKTSPFGEAYPDGNIFYGTEGIISGNALFDLEGNLVRKFPGGASSHFANFLQAVRDRKRENLNADVVEGHQSSSLCHVGNISYRLGRQASSEEIKEQLETINEHDDLVDAFERTASHLSDNGVDLDKTPLTLGPLLRIASGKETFVDNDGANSLLRREYRKPFVVPS